MFGRTKRKPVRPWVSAVIAAAGISTRMGSDKLVQEIGDAPLMIHTLRAYEACDLVREIILVVRSEAFVQYMGLASDYGITKLSQVVTGGATRLESVNLGVAACHENCQYIAVHDGARPCIAVEEIEAVCCAAFQSSCALAAMPIVDTVKRGMDGFVAQTLDRSTLFAAACPQVADKVLMAAALHNAIEKGIAVTDESMAWEEMGARPALIPCSKNNIKVTTAEDLILASVILGRRDGR